MSRVIHVVGRKPLLYQYKCYVCGVKGSKSRDYKLVALEREKHKCASRQLG